MLLERSTSSVFSVECTLTSSLCKVTFILQFFIPTRILHESLMHASLLCVKCVHMLFYHAENLERSLQSAWFNVPIFKSMREIASQLVEYWVWSWSSVCDRAGKSMYKYAASAVWTSVNAAGQDNSCCLSSATVSKWGRGLEEVPSLLMDLPVSSRAVHRVLQQWWKPSWAAADLFLWSLGREQLPGTSSGSKRPAIHCTARGAGSISAKVVHVSL